MIDLHCHILPGFDDGAADWETAVEMARIAADDGVYGIVATPHFYREPFPTPSLSTAHSRMLKLQELCNAADISLAVYLGADCRLHAEVIQNVEGALVPTLNGSRYLLLELPDDNIPPAFKNLVFEMCMAGITPIITHPERNRIVSKHPSFLYDVVQAGAYAQITAGSLMGHFGQRAQDAANLMLEHRLVHIIASDGHDTERRPPVLSEAVRLAGSIVGPRLAAQMVSDVPRAVLENQPIRFPEPIRPSRRGPKSLSFLKRALGAS